MNKFTVGTRVGFTDEMKDLHMRNSGETLNDKGTVTEVRNQNFVAVLWDSGIGRNVNPKGELIGVHALVKVNE